MAVDITLDSIIRRNLAKRKLPLHYYSPMLVMAKEGLDEMHFDTLQKLKTVVLTLDPTLKTANLPVDFVEAVIVGIEVGDKVRPIGYNHRINKKDTNQAFEQTADTYTFGIGIIVDGAYLDTYYNQYGGYKGRNYGRTLVFTDSYTILRELGKIRVDNKSDATEIHLTYLSMPEKVTNKSVIHPFAKQALHAWIDWEWAKYNKERDQEQRRRDFFNNLRILRARMNKMTTTEIIRIVRRGLKLSVKN